MIVLQPLFHLERGNYTLTASVEIVTSDGAKAAGALAKREPTEFTIKSVIDADDATKVVAIERPAICLRFELTWCV